MENKKDIGKAISDKLNSLDKTPKENVWNGISYELQKKKKRRIAFFFFWTKTLGLLLVGAIAAWYVYTQNDGFNTVSPKDANESVIVNGNDGKTNTNNSNKKNTEINDAKSNVNKNRVAGEENSIEKRNKFKNSNTVDARNLLDNNSNSLNSKAKKGSVRANRNNNSASKVSKSTKNTRSNQAKGELSKAKQSLTKSNQFSKVNAKKTKGKSKPDKETSTQSDLNTEQTTTALFDPKSLQNNSSIDKTKEVNTQKNDSLVVKKEKKKRVEIKPKEETKKDSTTTKDGFVRFHVDAFVSPTYYGYFSEKSTISRFLNSNSKTTEIEMNYGAGLSYDLTDRATIRISYTKVNLNYTTHDALVNTQNYSGIEYKPGITNETIYTASNNAETMDITQNLSYNEISLEGRYKFLDKKIGMNAIFGFSYLMLSENTVTVKTTNGFGQRIGKTKDLFETAASVNIGFGLDYKVFKNTKIFLEPMFNYQAMSFENSNYKPYYFGLHFGFRYALINK